MADETTTYPPIYFMLRGQALVEGTGHRRVVLTGGPRGGLQTCGPDGRLVTVNPEQGWPARIVLACNAFEPMRVALHAEQDLADFIAECVRRNEDPAIRGPRECELFERARVLRAAALRAADGEA